MSIQPVFSYLVFRLGQEIYRAFKGKRCASCGASTTNRTGLCDGCQRRVAEVQAGKERLEREERERVRQQKEDERHKEFVERAKDRAHWLSLSPHAFELQVARLFSALEYSVRPTPASNDAGVDIYMEKDGKKSVVQCKHFTRGNVSRPDVQQFFGVIIHENAAAGFFITTAGFSPHARAFAEGKPIQLIDLDALLAIGRQAGLQSATTTRCSNCGVPTTGRLCETCITTFARLLARDIPPCVRCAGRIGPFDERNDGLCPGCAAPL